MCISDIRGATEGKLFLSNGDLSKDTKQVRLIRIDSEIRLFVSFEEINEFFKRVDNYTTLYDYRLQKTLLTH